MCHRLKPGQKHVQKLESDGKVAARNKYPFESKKA
jgi:hypothetical protein